MLKVSSYHLIFFLALIWINSNGSLESNIISFSHERCISFLGQIATNWETSSNTNLSSHGSGGQKSEIKALVRPCSRRLWGEALLASSRCSFACGCVTSVSARLHGFFSSLSVSSVCLLGYCHWIEGPSGLSSMISSREL